MRAVVEFAGVIGGATVYQVTQGSRLINLGKKCHLVPRTKKSWQLHALHAAHAVLCHYDGILFLFVASALISLIDPWINP
jgi:hypothetical protein